MYRRVECPTMNTKSVNIVGLCHFFLNRTKQIREQTILCLLNKKEFKLLYNMCTEIFYFSRYMSYSSGVPYLSAVLFRARTVLLDVLKTHSAQQRPVLRNDSLVHPQRILQHALRPLCR